MINSIKRYLTNLYSKLKDADYGKILEYLLPENWLDYKKSYILFWGIALFSIIFVIWAAFAEINQVVRAQGEVIPDSKVHMIQSSLVGPVEKINIQLGDKVELNQILFHVDRNQAEKIFLISKQEVEAREKKVKIIENLVSKGSEAEMRLIDERLQLIDARKRYNQSERRLNLSEVKASVNGTVSNVNVTNTGTIADQGQTLAEIVPENDNLKIRASIMPRDIAYVKIGQNARIAFQSYDMAIFGQFDGIVTKLAKSTVTEKRNNQDFVFYPAVIEMDSKQFEELGTVVLQSGMMSDISIIGQQRTVLSYITNPITKLSQRALQE